MRGTVFTLPGLLVHADWGSDAKKRWMCLAHRSGSSFVVEAPELVGDLDSFWSRLRDRSDGTGLLVGFDFPIGLPSSFATLAGIQQFKPALLDFGSGSWSDFYTLAELPSEISIHRPFYPYGTVGTKQQHLLDGLGVTEMKRLLRRCELSTATRGAASSLFWTLGPKQVGRAAIIGWRDLLGPALQDPSIDLRLWPFDGDLFDIMAPAAVVVAETYPAEACVHLGMTPPGKDWSKRSQAGRAAQFARLTDWTVSRDVALNEQLVHLIRTGFGPSKSEEDPFDAMLGLLSMIEVVLGFRSEGAPLDGRLRNIEGWILGQSV